MSFEGYFQVLCKVGHLTDVDYLAHIQESEKLVCDCCESPTVWVNLVDCTNFDDEGFVELKEIGRDDKGEILHAPPTDLRQSPIRWDRGKPSVPQFRKSDLFPGLEDDEYPMELQYKGRQLELGEPIVGVEGECLGFVYASSNSSVLIELLKGK